MSSRASPHRTWGQRLRRAGKLRSLMHPTTPGSLSDLGSPPCQEGRRLGMVGGLGAVRPAGSVPAPLGSQAPCARPQGWPADPAHSSCLGAQPLL